MARGPNKISSHTSTSPPTDSPIYIGTSTDDTTATSYHTASQTCSSRTNGSPFVSNPIYVKSSEKVQMFLIIKGSLVLRREKTQRVQRGEPHTSCTPAHRPLRKKHTQQTNTSRTCAHHLTPRRMSVPVPPVPLWPFATFAPFAPFAHCR